jgi:aspartyl-tRNA(Asn)/glutamyl-tRNA(Gln) amidotransferase subunit B
VSDVNMEEGSLRCDANVSVREAGEEGFRTKTELKNMNSFRFIERGIEAEIARQVGIWSEGGSVVQETLHFDPATGALTPLRSKEEVHDYRYFPEPDLVPLSPTAEMLEAARAALPELPAARLGRYERDFGLPADAAAVLVGWEELGRFFEETLAAPAASGDGHGSEPVDPATLARWTTGELVARLREQGVDDPHESKLSPSSLAELVLMVQGRTLSQSAAKEVLAELTRSGGDPASVVEAKGLKPLADSGELEQIVERAIAQNEAAVEQIRKGKAQAAGAIVGAVMKETKGRADGSEVNRLIRQKLGID